MSLRISGHQYKVPAPLKNYITEKIPRLEKFGSYQTLEIVLEKDGFQILAEIRLKVGTVSITAKQKDAEPFIAVDKVFDKAETQLKKKFEKLHGKNKHKMVINRDAKKADLVSTIAAPTGNTRDTQREMPRLLEKLNVRVFPAGKTETNRMSVEEAAEELFFKDENFLMFRNADTGNLNLVYRRKDGNFAVVESGSPN